MKKVFLCLAVAIALFSYGCSSRPSLTAEEEGPYNECDALITQAGHDLDEAAQAGAESYAKEYFSTASLSLENSKKFLELKDFPKAKESATRASDEAKKTLAIPKQAENGIIETEKQIVAAKEAKIDLESPIAYKEAVDSLEDAKVAYNAVDYGVANVAALKAAQAIKKAYDEPMAASTAVNAVEVDMNKAKELKINETSPDAFKVAVEAYELSKSSLVAKDNPKAKENAEKASTTLKDEMKKSVNLFIKQAESDLNGAKEAGAADFAAEQLAVAEEALSNSNSSFEKADYMAAKASAEKVSATAKEALVKAKAGKEAKAAAEAAAATPVATEATTATETPAATETAAVTETPAATETATEAPAATEAPVVKETPVVEKVKEVEPKAEVKKEIKEEETPVEVAKTVKTKSGSKFPLIPAVALVLVAVVVVFVIRIVRKKATSTTTA